MDLGVAGYSVTAPLYTDVNMYVCTYTLGPFYLLLLIIFFASAGPLRPGHWPLIPGI